MPLRLTNTLTRRKELFTPLSSGKASIYCCGVTVYDHCHLGHARSYINWDVLRRYLIWSGLDVTFVQNFTDIDDKIIKRALEEHSSVDAISRRNINAFHEDMDALGILRPDRMPRATQSLDSIRALIGELEAKGAAYSVDGDVYFAVMKHSGYGKISRRNLSEQQDNATGRVTNSERARKQHPFDFVLWKGTKEDEPSFPSPWGAGRPGWHIECSAMVRAELGDTIDIHLGGADLIFPHHENEIAQSESVTGQKLAQIWMHNGMVNVGGQKMSKSLGNFTTIRTLFESGISPMTLRTFVLRAHYRKPLDFTNDALDAADVSWKGLNAALGFGHRYGESLGWQPVPDLTNGALVSATSLQAGHIEPLKQRFINAMDNDLNSSEALSVLFDLAKPLRALTNRFDRGDKADLTTQEALELDQRWRLLRDLGAVLGLRYETNTASPGAGDSAGIEVAIEAREAARASKNYAEADRIREVLIAQGIELIDKPGGITEWIRS
ncbi:cysteine--tRNA ligase [Synechococcus sp. M16CYN]|uniref:cysteine--tRNA ligase n=1 Tax=Synechococcus sp. M16CYN TaxID=3103139 RepID=UPI00324B1D15